VEGAKPHNKGVAYGEGMSTEMEWVNGLIQGQEIDYFNTEH